MNVLLFAFGFLLMNDIDGQEFCDSYIKNNFSAVMSSADGMDLFVFVNEFYWVLRVTKTRLYFVNSDREANGRIEGLADRMTTIFHKRVFSQKTNSMQSYFIFYDVRTIMIECH